MSLSGEMVEGESRIRLSLPKIKPLFEVLNHEHEKESLGLPAK